MICYHETRPSALGELLFHRTKKSKYVTSLMFSFAVAHVFFFNLDYIQNVIHQPRPGHYSLSKQTVLFFSCDQIS